MKPGRISIPGLANRRLRSAKLLRDVRAFCRRAVSHHSFAGRITSLLIQRHEAVLLAADANPADATALDFLRNLENHCIHGRSPLLRMLLHMSDGKAWDQRVRSPRLRDDLASVEVEDDRFDTLRSGINADEEGHRIKCRIYSGESTTKIPGAAPPQSQKSGVETFRVYHRRSKPFNAEYAKRARSTRGTNQFSAFSLVSTSLGVQVPQDPLASGS